MEQFLQVLTYPSHILGSVSGYYWISQTQLSSAVCPVSYPQMYVIGVPSGLGMKLNDQSDRNTELRDATFANTERKLASYPVCCQ